MGEEVKNLVEEFFLKALDVESEEELEPFAKQLSELMSDTVIREIVYKLRMLHIQAINLVKEISKTWEELYQKVKEKGFEELAEKIKRICDVQKYMLTLIEGGDGGK